jgi:hypothetical protein
LDAFVEYSLARIENRSRQLMSIFLKLLQVVPKAHLLAAQDAHRRASTPKIDG